MIGLYVNVVAHLYIGIHMVIGLYVNVIAHLYIGIHMLIVEVFAPTYLQLVSQMHTSLFAVYIWGQIFC